MILWMAWSTLVTLLLGFAAFAAERSLRATGRSARGVWGLSILGGLALQAWALLRTAEPLTPGPAGAVKETASLTISMLTELQAAAASVPALLYRYETAALIAWVGAAVVAVAVLLGGLARLESLARNWGRAHVAGEDVLISEDFGPALVGLRAPTIVLPGWALDLPPNDLQLACLHEAEHRRAHDTWLLFAAALVAALTPWNAALWWNVRRLRAAVEIDCDARVLNAGASPTAYGALLLELTSSIGDHRLPVASFAKPPSLLERRLTMIVGNVRHGVPVGSLAALAVCALLVVAACESAPTMALPTQGDQAAVEAGEFRIQGTVAKAAIEAGQFLLQGTVAKAAIEAGHFPLQEAVARAVGEPRTIRLNGQASVDGKQPLIYVDGIRISEGLPKLDPNSIERIEVLKGEAAYERYGDEASAGVIQIFMKKGTVEAQSSS